MVSLSEPRKLCELQKTNLEPSVDLSWSSPDDDVTTTCYADKEQRMDAGDLLPEGWERRENRNRNTYYVDWNTRTVTLFQPNPNLNQVYRQPSESRRPGMVILAIWNCR